METRYIVQSYGIRVRETIIPDDTDFGGCMINRIKTSWLVEFISIAFSFLATLLVVTVSDIAK